MTTLVTGATGFLGSHVARQLLARGERVRVLVRPRNDRRALEGSGAEIVEGDLRDAASLDRAMAGVNARLPRRRGLPALGAPIRAKSTNPM